MERFAVSRLLFGVRKVGVRIAVFAMAFAGLCSTAASAATFTAIPSSLAFGNQVVNTNSAAQTITLTNTAKNALVFTLSFTGLSDYTVTSDCGNVLPPSGTASCTLTVVFHPVATGSRPGSVLIIDNGKSNNRQTVTFSGTGVAAVSVTPSSLAFGNVA